MDPKTILSTPCDVLVPAAIGNVIDAATAEQIEAKYVVEAANGPTTPEGDAVLRKRGITVLPDIYTNGGMLLRSRAHPERTCLHTRLQECGCKHARAQLYIVACHMQTQASAGSSLPSRGGMLLRSACARCSDMSSKACWGRCYRCLCALCRGCDGELL